MCSTGKHWKIKDVSKMKGNKNALGSIRTETSKQKNREWHLQHYTFENHKKDCSCSFCKAKRGEYKGKNNPFYGKRHPDELKEKWRKTRKDKPRPGNPENWGGWKQTIKTRKAISKNNASNIPEIKEKNKKWHIEHPNKRFSGTIIEKKIEVELKNRGFIRNKDYYCNKDIKGIANVDFYLPEHKIVIECDGCYYHNCLIHFPESHKTTREADKQKTKKLEKAGYKVYRFWEHEINKSPEECIKQIKIQNEKFF